MSKHTIEDLIQFQSLPLSVKVRMSEERIRMWVREFGESGVYISFSGGKDSTVLLDIVRNRLGYKDIPAVFVDTGLEYPEIRQFVKTFDNVVILKPEMNFRSVISKYGYPFISKEISCKFDNMYSAHSRGKVSYVDRQLEGRYVSKNGRTNKLPITKWVFLRDAPFRISHQCCNVMKKNPLKKYEKLEGRFPITAEMANESFLRKQVWLKNGCNMFDIKRPKSTPLAFWTEQDILEYCLINNIKLCSVYGSIDCDITKNVLTTSGCKRTGCMFCGFGCHCEKPGEGRFLRLKLTHPLQYHWIFKDWEKGGLGYQKVIEWLNENGNLNIQF